jgi:hypothetical protein
MSRDMVACIAIANMLTKKGKQQNHDNDGEGMLMLLVHLDSLASPDAGV